MPDPEGARWGTSIAVGMGLLRLCRGKLVFLFRIPLSLLCLPVGRGRRMLRQNGSQLPRRYTPRRYHRLALSKYLAGFSGVAGRDLLA